MIKATKKYKVNITFTSKDNDRVFNMLKAVLAYWSSYNEDKCKLISYRIIKL